jgi:hypothetical protein
MREHLDATTGKQSLHALHPAKHGEISMKLPDASSECHVKHHHDCKTNRPAERTV